MAKKTPQLTPMRVPAHGKGKLRVGGTNKGGTGRPPDEFKAAMARLASRDSLIEKLEEILTDPQHQHFIQAMKHVTEHGYGKPKESKEVTKSEDSRLTVTFRNE